MIIFKECGLDFLMGNGICNEQTNNVICEFDGGDCCDPLSYYLCEDCPCYPDSTTVTNEPECIFGPKLCGNTIGFENLTTYRTIIPKLIKPENACDCMRPSLIIVCLMFLEMFMALGLLSHFIFSSI